MVIKNSRVNGAFPFCDIFAEAVEKPRLINIVFKYLRLVDAPHHDMMQGSRHIQSRLSRHEVIVFNTNRFVNVFAR